MGQEVGQDVVLKKAARGGVLLNSRLATQECRADLGKQVKLHGIVPTFRNFDFSVKRMSTYKLIK